MDKFLVKAPKRAAEDDSEVTKVAKVDGVPSLDTMHVSWRTALAPEFAKPYFKSVRPLSLLLPHNRAYDLP